MTTTKPLTDYNTTEIAALSGLSLRLATAEAVGLKIMHKRFTRGVETWTYDDQAGRVQRTQGPYPEIPSYEADPKAAYEARQWMYQHKKEVQNIILNWHHRSSIPYVVSVYKYVGKIDSELWIQVFGATEMEATCRAACLLAKALGGE